jgi:hypothetical protein
VEAAIKALTRINLLRLPTAFLQQLSQPETPWTSL